MSDGLDFKGIMGQFSCMEITWENSMYDTSPYVALFEELDEIVTTTAEAVYDCPIPSTFETSEIHQIQDFDIPSTGKTPAGKTPEGKTPAGKTPGTMVTPTMTPTTVTLTRATPTTVTLKTVAPTTVTPTTVTPTMVTPTMVTPATVVSKTGPAS
jgi:hypothetical protein